MLHIKYTRNFIMEQSTQTMKEYISIYDKPKRGKGRPVGSKYADEEKVWDQGYQQTIIIIEILEKKEKDIDCYITKKEEATTNTV